MKAIVLKSFGSADNLQVEELPVPGIKEDEVLVQVKAISINPVDAKTRAGKAMAGTLKDLQPVILGWDIAGIITKAGSAVTNFKEGDAVFGMVNFPGHGKAYAEYVAAPAAHLAHKPKNISYEEAAAATLAALTAWQGLMQVLQIQKGDTLLVHAAAGGVGHFAIQIAKHLGAYVIGTASAPNKDFVLSIGADEFVDYKARPLNEVLHGIDKVFDTIGGDNIDISLEVMKPGGTIVSIVSGRNDKVDEKAAAKGMVGKTMLVTSNGADQQTIADLIEQQIVKPHVSKTFAFNEMPQAHIQIESGRTVGKIVVNP